MIPSEALEVFAKFSGDDDGFLRLGSPDDHAVMTLELWDRIAQLIRDAQLVHSGAADADYAARIRAAVATEFPEPPSRSVFFRIAGIPPFV